MSKRVMPYTFLRSYSSVPRLAWSTPPSPLPATPSPHCPLPASLVPSSLLSTSSSPSTSSALSSPGGNSSAASSPTSSSAPAATSPPPSALLPRSPGFPIAIQEQNAIPGITNRLIAPYASKIFLAFNGCVKYFPKPKCLVYGNPIRLALRKFVEKSAARAHFFPSIGSKVGDEKAQVVLVLGGSQGDVCY